MRVCACVVSGACLVLFFGAYWLWFLAFAGKGSILEGRKARPFSMLEVADFVPRTRRACQRCASYRVVTLFVF